ncbi:Hsp70 family protein [Boeremia exigua]|uniref:Hsp70 family protein n=1 Tax=Boeremia exigua TaxID=749465 RepID=UPI001E8DA553|nr:Hsp70 family protein [Boeremia exigua]KAH6633342.1 Hsp70 family protein [Boeremia exigua]
MKGTRLVIGLDYGTTYTGLSFCETSGDTDLKNELIEIVHDWPSAHSKIATKEKVPSEVTYQPEGLVWGSLIPPNVQRHIWTKLELENHPNGEAAKQDTKSSSSIVLYKPPVDIIADFLGQVKAHLIGVLDRKYGENLWRTLPVTLVVTMPAVWSDGAKARTRQAVDKAGFNVAQFPQLTHIINATEPESAAIYTIRTLRNTAHDTQFATGDGFILCDLGGGTADLISYKVARLSPTVVEEITVGSGDQCGGTFVDRAFLQWLERRLGTEDFVKIAGCRSEQIPRTMLSNKAARMLQNFTLEVKGGFSGTESYTLQLPSPLSAIEDDEVRGIEDGEIRITSNDLISMFEMPIRRTYELLTKQLKEARKAKKVHVKYVFLVGGFSESAYMYRKIKEWAEDNGLKALRPSYAWSAVARGAVAKGLEGDTQVVAARKNRRHYGTVSSKIFISGIHRETEAAICPYTGVKRAHSQMNWLLKQGQTLPTSGPAHAKISMSTLFWLTQERTSTLRLEASNRARAPKRSVDAGVYRVAKATVDLSKVPEKAFLKKMSPIGRPYVQLNYEIELFVQSSLEMYLSVDGKRYGELTAAFD